MYKGRLISYAHSEIFCQRTKVATRTQCVLVATTLLHSGAKFHSFLYTGSKTVRVNIESCYGGMSTRLKQRAVTEFLSAENVTPAEIHRRLQAVYLLLFQYSDGCTNPPQCYLVQRIAINPYPTNVENRVSS